MNSPTQPRKGLAITSLLLGLIGLFTLGILGVGAVIGVVMGMIAWSKARNNPSVYGGEGVALAGLITNALSLLIAILFGLIAAISIPNLISARRSANQVSAVRTLRQIAVAQIVFQQESGNGNFASELSQLRSHERGAGYLEDSIVQSQNIPKNGYLLGPVKTTPATSAAAATFSITIYPAGQTGSLRAGNDCFFIDETGIVRHSRSPTLLPDANSEPLK